MIASKFITDLLAQDEGMAANLEFFAYSGWQTGRDTYWYYEMNRGNQWITLFSARKGCKALTEKCTFTKSESESDWELRKNDRTLKFKSLDHLLRYSDNYSKGGLLESSLVKDVEAMTWDDMLATTL
jgi:hypothetical protein